MDKPTTKKGRKELAFKLFAEGKTTKDPLFKGWGREVNIYWAVYRRMAEDKRREDARLAAGNNGDGNGENGEADDPEESKDDDRSAKEKPKAVKKDKAEKSVAVEPAKDLGTASYVVIKPRQFTMGSTLLWQAKEAAINEWGWPKDISDEDFLDTFLFEAFAQRDIILGGYQILSRGDGNGSKRSEGQRSISTEARR